MVYKQPVAQSMLVLPGRRPGSPPTKLLAPVSYEHPNVWRPESPISQMSEQGSDEPQPLPNIATNSPSSQRPDRSGSPSGSPSHRPPTSNRREDQATANRMRLPTPSPPQRSPPRSPAEAGAGRDGMVGSLDLQGSGALLGAPPPLEPVDGANVVWDIVAIIQQAATRKMVTIVRNYILTYDPKETGLVNPAMFKAALDMAEVFVTTNDFRRLTGAYTAKKGAMGIHWKVFLSDISSSRKFAPKYLRATTQETRARQVDQGVIALLERLQGFFRQRRINVRDAFADFERPSVFCKKLQRVTYTQFEEALAFACSGLASFTQAQAKVIASAYDDGHGLVRYRAFVADMDPRIEPSTGFIYAGSGDSMTESPPSSPMQSPGRPSSPTPFSNEAQTFGPHDSQFPTRIMAYSLQGNTEEVIQRVRNKCFVYNIILHDHLRQNDRHSEGSVTLSQFARTMDALRCFQLSEKDINALRNDYVFKPSPNDVRFNYARFCNDVQPMGPKLAVQAAQLPRDIRSTSPLAVQDLTEEEEEILNQIMVRFAESVRSRRCTFRRFFEDFDRMCKTRSGTTSHNYALNPGCISRSQFRQALSRMGCAHLVNAQELFILFKRYERRGEFNQLVFIRDMDAYEQQSWLASNLSVAEG